MTDQSKGKSSKSVMGNLPSTRPTRMSRHRDAEPKPKPAAKPTRATPKAVGKPATKAGPKPKATAAASAPKAASKPKATELVTTAVQATGELAKIGLTLGGQALKRAVDRLPKP